MSADEKYMNQAYDDGHRAALGVGPDDTPWVGECAEAWASGFEDGQLYAEGYADGEAAGRSAALHEVARAARLDSTAADGVDPDDIPDLIRQHERALADYAAEEDEFDG